MPEIRTNWTVKRKYAPPKSNFQKPINNKSKSIKSEVIQGIYSIAVSTVTVSKEKNGKEYNTEVLSRVAVCNSLGRVIYTSYAKSLSRVINYHSEETGVYERNLLNAPSIADVISEVKRVIKLESYETDNEIVDKKKINLNKGFTLVGYNLPKTLKLLSMEIPQKHLIDIRTCGLFCDNFGLPMSLRDIAKAHLQFDMNGKIKDCGEEASVTMKLYMRRRASWESGVASYFKRFGKYTLDEKIEMKRHYELTGEILRPNKDKNNDDNDNDNDNANNKIENKDYEKNDIINKEIYTNYH